MNRGATGSNGSASTTARFVEAAGATLVVGLVAWLIGANAIPPWDAFRLTPSSDLERAIAVVLASASALTCVWRLIQGAPADSELERLGDALTEDDDAGGPLAAFGDVTAD